MMRLSLALLLTFFLTLFVLFAVNATTLHWGTAHPKITQWWIYLGSQKGGKDILDSGDLGKNTYMKLARVPKKDLIWVRLWYRLSGTWHSVDFHFAAGGTLVGHARGPGISMVINDAPAAH